MEHRIEPGLIKDYRKITGPSDGIDLPGSLELSYLVSTPAVVNMVIEASTEMLDDLLPSDYTTVGTHIELSHENPTLVGEPINIRLKVAEVDNNKVIIEVEGFDSQGRFLKGRYERHIVNKSRLMQHAYGRFPDSTSGY
jgi:predicted thioesterase